MSNKLKSALVAAALTAGAVGPVVAVADTADAAVTCRAGTWGGVWGWGDCTGTGKWRLKVSCTWGASATSSILTGAGHVDVKCPWGSARSASIIYL